jgi:EF-P beta-lysylation protein EpmB
MTSPVVSIIDSDQPEKWQQMLSDLITDPKELLQILGLNATDYPGDPDMLRQFPMKVPRPFAARMEAGNWRDPLLLQVLPSSLEAVQVEGLVADPLQEAAANPVPGLLHKYAGRVLLTAVPHCAVHCRYCFRRHFDYAGNAPNRSEWVKAIDYIAADPGITEVILSGGDPLAASDRHLRWLIDRINDIEHVSSLRLHTRLPIVLPQRVTPGLAALLGGSRAKPVLVVHCNHAQELDLQVASALSQLTDNRIILLNQAVLLRDVNDNLPALVALSKRLFQLHVLPYYLHLPDRVAGTAHFQVSAATGRELISGMQAQLPGYLVPTLVQEQPGASAKTRLA